MRSKKKLRFIIPLVLMAIAGVAFATHSAVGTVSAIGLNEISLICPVGALETMLASKMLIPRALISLIIIVVLIVIFGRAFCAWVCPVPLVSKLRDAFAPKKTQNAVSSENAGNKKTRVKTADLDARYCVLGASLLSALIFGFPVFCLICPVGLSFAAIFLLIRAFGFSDPSWTLVIVIAILFIEVVFFRKWCHTFCPISACMSLIARKNKNFQPSIQDTKCMETGHNTACGRCFTVCPEGIDPRHPLRGRGRHECTKCYACVESCPTQALSITFLPKKDTHVGSIKE